ncbi:MULTISPECIES: hypothetical protein [Providencia]|uniref:Uncharacterized protein n=1 Tax=Providencia rettgeri TaxID=587 RepID=A0AAP2NXU5_PRORE|nr:MULTISPECIES: hypothetical protein [Providencia]APC09770.1 hypothetical protein RB151_000540 [Providencia rettgeri]AVL73434.1 hypothetical protein CEQ08_06730 [Providencia rettgeri]EJD6044378.1 hypothetical protein [Providencia rettgeri]EJD6672833.1 hypothetical protein [Providencia rettgeri]EKH6497666.1 hypothetical protein [Providencia rettgeri]
MNKTKSANQKIFDQILSVNKQKENEFNNGQDGATILSLLVMFFVPFLLLNVVRNAIGIDYSFASVIGMLAISGIITIALFKTLKISSQFADKHIVLDRLLSRYTPKNKQEFQQLQEERKTKSADFYSLVEDWVNVEKQYYAR